MHPQLRRKIVLARLRQELPPVPVRRIERAELAVASRVRRDAAARLVPRKSDDLSLPNR
jgi:hypothetical protein